MIERPPRLTGTVWDIVIGAAVEHACLTHGSTPPEWIDESARFSDELKILIWLGTETTLARLPAPFARRGVVFDPRNLDQRTGDERWAPELGNPDGRWPRTWTNGGKTGSARDLAVETLGTTAATIGTDKGLLETTYRACAGIEREGARAQWAVRIALKAGKTPRVFGLRGANTADGRLTTLPAGQAAELVTTGLKHANVAAKDWKRLLREISDADREKRQPRTVWNRPALTISGVATGILKTWEEAARS